VNDDSWDVAGPDYEFRRLITVGTANPTGGGGPRAGDLVFRSDIRNPEWFFYDTSSSRNQWLSMRTFDLFFTHASGAATYLDAHDTLVSSGTYGYLLDEDYTLCEFNILRDATGTTPTYRLTANGTDIAQSIYLLTTDTVAWNQSLAIQRTRADVIGCRILAGTSTGNVMAQARFRRRIT